MKTKAELLTELTPEEKSLLVSGTNFMYTNGSPRLDIKKVRMSDGPHGLRVQNNSGDNGVSGSEPATAFPTAALTACSWNPNTLFKMGEAISKEARFYNIDVVLGPGANIKRNSLAGRNFEYFSEDPLLSGKMAANEIKGIQSQNVGTSLKHFALNNQENFRFMGDSIADNRAMREIYLKSFEIAIKEGKPDTVMCSYNKINGTYSCQNKWLLTDVLRNEWGFNGLVMTDWGATHSRVNMLKAGLDLEMPGDTPICRKWILDGLKDKTLPLEDLDKACSNVLNLAIKHSKDNKIKNFDFKENDLLAEEIALDSAVLLKNDGLLPLSKDKEYLVVGELFEKMRYQGAGSSMINPTNLTTPKTAFDNNNIKYKYYKGYKENKLEPDQDLIEEVVKNVNNYDTILVFLGLTDYVESEGCDRENMSLPNNQLSLINNLIKLNKKIVVILYGGSPVEFPFKNNVNAILNMYLPGQRGGEATRKLLFGEKNPCGKLAETWVNKYEDIPYSKDFSKTEIEVYKESIFVGYRYYSTLKKEVAFPFGFGLSYTTFEYSNLKIEEENNSYKVTATIKNTGSLYGGEIVELYVKCLNSNVFRPEKELKGFTKVYLKPNESKEITIIVNKEDLAYFNIKENRFVLESGDYEFQLSSDSLTVKESSKIHIDGEELESPYSSDILEIYKNNPQCITNDVFEKMSGLKIPKSRKKTPITLESRFSDLKETFIGRILFNAVLSVAKKDMKKAKKLPEGAEKDNKIKGALFLKRILESNSIITMSMSAGKSCPYNFALGFVDLANGHIIKGIKDFLHPIKIEENK